MADLNAEENSTAADGFYAIGYRFETNDGRVFEDTLRIDARRLTQRDLLAQTPPEWAALEGIRCPSCILSDVETPVCRAAVVLARLLEHFGDMLAYDQVKAIVTTPERIFIHTTSLQRALSSLIGLHMATSGCPSLGFLKPLARFHTPFATQEETFFRCASAWLLGQYYRKQHGKAPDWDFQELRQAYARLHEVNVSISRCLREIVENDASVNALVLLDLFTQTVPLAIYHQLPQLECLYTSYLERP